MALHGDVTPLKCGLSVSTFDQIAFWKANGWIDHLRSGAHLVVTGGEPLLQQKNCIVLLYFLLSYMILNRLLN